MKQSATGIVKGTFSLQSAYRRGLSVALIVLGAFMQASPSLTADTTWVQYMSGMGPMMAMGLGVAIAGGLLSQASTEE